MKHVYRLCKKAFSQLNGEGARLFGGRWNSPGKAALYVAENISLAVLETLVHLDPSHLPTDYVWLKIALPDCKIDDFGVDECPPESICRSLGNAWLQNNVNLAVRVPSALVPFEEGNVILNPQHDLFAKVQTVSTQPFAFDPRFSI